MSIPQKKNNFRKLLARGSATIVLSSNITFPQTQAGYNVTHSYTTSESPSLPYPSNASVEVPPPQTNTVTNQMVQLDGATCSHASGIVNGHFSVSPPVNASYQVYDLSKTHGSHGSHSNHCSGCCCCANW